MQTRFVIFASSFLPLLATAHAQVRLTNDNAGYVSAYTIGTGISHTDPVIDECSIAKGRQNEPAVAVDPRNADVLVGSSNDYCGVYAGSTGGNFVPAGPIWLGYYRSEDGGVSFVSSLVPGYPGDTSPFAALAQIRTASAGDPVIAWDNHGRVFFGSESSDDPAGSKKTFGDVWVARFENSGGGTINDGKMYTGTSLVAKGASAPNLLGKFHDKTAIEADRTAGACDGNVYFSWARFNTFGSNIYFSRSTDHGMTWSTPMLLTSNIKNVQDPDIAVTGNGHVYVTFDMGATVSGQTEGVGIAKSTDCGKTFAKPTLATSYIGYEALDISTPQPVPPPSGPSPRSPRGPSPLISVARDCGDFSSACQSGYTFFRRATTTRSTADQLDTSHEWIYIVYDAGKPGTEVDTGTSYGARGLGTGVQTGVYFVKYDGANGTATTPALIDNQANGHQIFPDISADDGVLHALWWDSRNDGSYSAARPIGNDASGHVGASLDVYATSSTTSGANWTSPVRLTTSTNPNYEQFSDRTVPFAGDYLWITSKGTFSFGVWTDWNSVMAGTGDPREPGNTDGADVKQCRAFDASTGWSGDQCPHDGGIDQNILGSVTP